jgi:putative inorganic carbon (HCO3(-)) transporter
MSKRLDQVIAAGLMIIVIFTALAHGAIEPWSVAIYSMLILGLFELWALKLAIDKEVAVKFPVEALPLAMLVGFGLIQSIALTGGNGQRTSLSTDPEATRAATASLFLLLMVFILAANFLTSRRRLEFLAWLLAVFGFLLSVFAIIQHYTWNGLFYWVRPMGTPPSPFGPFLNHSNFASYIVMLIPIPIGLAITRAVRGPARLFCAFMAVVMSLATILSLSRGGIVSLALGLVFLGILAVSRFRFSDLGMGGRRTKRRQTEFHHVGSGARRFQSLATVALIIIAVLVGLLWLGPEAVINRINQGQLTGSEGATETFFTSRGWIWRDTLAMIRANPLLGVGLGAFSTAYPIYTQSNGSLLVAAAHNDYLQILAECGVVGAALALWFLMLVIRAIFRGVQSSDPLFAGLAMGGGAGVFSALMHSFFDFNLQIPSIALMFLLLSALVAHLGAVAVEPVTEKVELELPQAHSQAASVTKVVSS